GERSHELTMCVQATLCDPSSWARSLACARDDGCETLTVISSGSLKFARDDSRNDQGACFRAISNEETSQASMPAHHVIAIDGPAASGKSSVARTLAQRLGFSHVNSGAMYRAVTWHVLQRSVDLHQPAAVVAAVEQSKIVCELVDNQSRILIDDHDPTSHLRDDNVNRAVSIVSSIPRVRQILVPRMRECAKAKNVVMEGRDIGSV